MDAIFNFFDWFSEIISSVFDWFSGFLENTMNLFKYLGAALELVTGLIVELPFWLQVFGYITVAVSVAFLALGRETGGNKQ